MNATKMIKVWNQKKKKKKIKFVSDGKTETFGSKEKKLMSDLNVSIFFNFVYKIVLIFSFSKNRSDNNKTTVRSSPLFELKEQHFSFKSN